MNETLSAMNSVMIGFPRAEIVRRALRMQAHRARLKTRKEDAGDIRVAQRSQRTPMVNGRGYYPSVVFQLGYWTVTEQRSGTDRRFGTGLFYPRCRFACGHGVHSLC